MEGDKTLTICRLCLSGNGRLIHVFESTGNHGYATADIITELLRLEVSVGDIYPQCVCSECMGRLRDFKIFKEQCLSCKDLLDRAYASKCSSPSGDRSDEQMEDKDGSGWKIVSVGSVEETTLDGDLIVPKNGADAEGALRPIPFDELKIVALVTSRDSKNNCDDGAYLHGSGSLFPDNLALPPTEDPLRDSKAGIVDGHSKDESEMESWSCDYGWDMDSEKVNLDTDDDKKGITALTTSSLVVNSMRSPLSEEESVINLQTGIKRELSQHSEVSRDSSDSCEDDEGVKWDVFGCPKCGKEYPTEEGCRRHVYEYRCGSSFKCYDCGRCFPDKRLLTAHSRTHTDEENVCTICGKGFKNKYLLKGHVFRHGERKVKCEDCGKLFFTFSELKVHKTTHERDRVHSCDQCGKVFHNKSNLYNHKNIHKGEVSKKYACEVCGSKVRTPSQLIAHMRTHTGEKPFPCSECEMSFSMKSSLHVHMKRHLH